MRSYFSELGYSSWKQTMCYGANLLTQVRLCSSLLARTLRGRPQCLYSPISQYGQRGNQNELIFPPISPRFLGILLFSTLQAKDSAIYLHPLERRFERRVVGQPQPSGQSRYRFCDSHNFARGPNFFKQSIVCKKSEFLVTAQSQSVLFVCQQKFRFRQLKPCTYISQLFQPTALKNN